MKKWIVILIVIAAFAGAIYYRFDDLKNKPVDTDITLVQKENGIPVRTFIVQPESLADIVVISGTINPLIAVKISPKISERITQLHATTGQYVKKDQLLVSLDSKLAQLGILQSQASLARANSTLEKLLNGSRIEEIQSQQAMQQQAQADWDLAKLEYQRQLKLLQEESSTQQKLDSVKANLDSSKARYDAAVAQYQLTKKGPRSEDIELARAEVKLAQVALDQAIENLSYHELKAPFAGFISKNNFEVNDLIAMNQTIFELMDISKVYLDIRVSEIDIPKIKIGQTVKVKVDALPDNSFDATIAQIDPLGGQLDRSFLTRVLLDNSQGLLKPAMFGRAIINTDTIANAIAVPADAIKRGLTDQGEPQAYVLIADADGIVQRQDIVVGDTYGDKIHVIDGLQADMNVILMGYGLNIGDKVKVVE
ncbi:MAG: efflux RND transporter periplasmic adaptor subunit [Phycisphaerae bacterium]|nr:efflux RND transporter periplasmic adaptor subunit [Phycisphaerae bacterium]